MNIENNIDKENIEEDLSKDKENSPKKRIGIILILFIFLIGIIIINRKNIKSLFKDNSYKIKTMQTVDLIDLGELENINIYDEQTVAWNNNSLQYFRTEKNDKPIKLDGRKVICGSEYIYLIDNESKSIKVLDLKGKEVTTINSSEESKKKSIYNIIEDKENLLIHYKSGNEETIRIGDFKWDTLLEHNIKNENILSTKVNDRRNRYVISSLKISDMDLKTNIAMHNRKKDLVWKLSLEDEIVVDMLMIRDDVIAITDMNIYYISNGEIVWEKILDVVDDIVFLNDDIYILYNNTIEIVDTKGDTIGKLSLEKDYDNLINFNEYIVLYGQRNILGIRDDNKIFELNYKTDIVDVKSSSSMIGVQSETQFEWFKIVDKK